MTDHPTPETEAAPALNGDVPHATPERPLSEAARRALLEAARRALLEAAGRRAAGAEADLPTEHGGPTGPEPTRYGDWEKKGLAVDF